MMVDVILHPRPLRTCYSRVHKEDGNHHSGLVLDSGHQLGGQLSSHTFSVLRPSGGRPSPPLPPSFPPTTEDLLLEPAKIL